MKKENFFCDNFRLDEGDPAPPPERDGEQKEREDADRGSQRTGIERMGSIVTRGGDVTVNCVTLIGQIEGHYTLSPSNKSTKYEHIIPLLVSVEEDPAIDGLLIILNTVGGDVEAGLALAELLASMSKPTVSLVLGGGHSIGVPLAVSARRSFIAPSATMMVHPVRMNGLVIGVEQSFNYFTRMQERINGFIVRHSKIDKALLERIMYSKDELTTDVGSIIESGDAVAYGLIDKVGGLSEALAELKAIVRKERGKKGMKGKGTGV